MNRPTLQAAAQLELNRRRAEGRGVAVLIQRGEQWRCRGRLLTAGEASAFRRTYRGPLVIVHLEAVPVPDWSKP